MGDMAEGFRAMKENARHYKQANRVKFVNILRSLDYSQHMVEEITPYQYRIDGKLDIYPSNRKWHLIPTGERGQFRNFKEIEELLK